MYYTACAVDMDCGMKIKSKTTTTTTQIPMNTKHGFE